MNAECLLEVVNAARDEWEGLLVRIPKETWREPLPASPWNLLDLLAHIAWYELEAAALLDSKDMTAGSPWWMLSTEDRNVKIYELYRGRPETEIVNECAAAANRLEEAIARQTEGELNDPSRYEGMPEEWVPWRIVAQNSYEHRFQHMHALHAAIRRISPGYA